MFAFLTPFIGWLSGPFFTFLKGLPRWVWIAILAVLTGKYLYEKGKSEGKSDGKEKVEDIKEQIKEINHDTEQRVENAEKAAIEIEEQLFDGGDYTTDDLNHQQLRKLAENDPNNRRRGM